MDMIYQDSCFLGFDIGASSVKYGYTDSQLSLLHFGSKTYPERSLNGMHLTFQEILTEVDAAIGLSKIAGVGIGTAGTIDRRSGLLRGVNPNLPFWVLRDPRELIPSEYQLPVYCDNDANLMTLAEAASRTDCRCVAGITVGSGIGCGLAYKGQVYHGAHGYAMELGHVTVVDNGEPCNCGRRGCLEAYASVDGIKRRIAAHFPGKDTQSWGLREVLEAEWQNQHIRTLIAEGEVHLASAVANLIITLDADAVIIGGGGMDGGLYNIGRMRNAIQARLPELNRMAVVIEEARMGNKAGVLGAVRMARQQVSGISE